MRVLLGPGVTLMSRNGRDPSSFGSSMVNCMCGSCALMWWSCWLCSTFWMTKVSSTNLRHRQEVWGSSKGLDLKLFHEQIGNEGADGGTHGCTMNLFIILTLEEEVSVLRQKSSNMTICWMDMLVLWGNVGCCSKILLNYLYGEVPQNQCEKGLNIIWFNFLAWFQSSLLYTLHKMCIFEVVWRLTNQGADDVCQFLCHPICNGNPTGHNGSEGVPTLWIFKRRQGWYSMQGCHNYTPIIPYTSLHTPYTITPLSPTPLFQWHHLW